jgi:predicted ATPase
MRPIKLAEETAGRAQALRACAGRTIAITGGPCGGKTTICRWLARHLRRLGHEVICLPEAARLAISILGQAHTPREKLALQEFIVRLQLALEDAAISAAAKGSIILQDRGILDSKGYLPPIAWKTLQKRLGLTEAQVVKRYAAVIHLTSCAVDKPDVYRGDKERKESLAGARKVDAAILRGWRSHPVQIVIPNHNHGLAWKRQQVLQVVLQIARI